MSAMAAAIPPTSQVVVLAAGTLAMLAVLLWSRSPRAYLVIAVIVLAVSRFSIAVGGLTLRADQLAVPLLAVPLFGAAHTDCDTERRSHHLLTPLLAAYIGLGGLSRAVNGAPASEVIRATLLVGVAAFAFWIPLFLVRRGLTAAAITTCVITVGAAAGALAVVLAAASYLSPSSLGVQRDPANPSLHLAYVTFYEANLLGAFLAAALILAVLHPAVASWRPALRTAVPLVMAAGLLATLTRGSWVGLAVGMGAGAWALRTRASHHHNLWLKLVLVGAALVTIVAVTPLRSTITARLAGLLDFSSGSGFGRLRIAKLAMTEWHTSPLIGHGFLSFDHQLPGSPAGQSAWIPSFSIAVLHDTGLLGAAIMALFFAALMRRLWRNPDRTTAASWIGVSLCLLVASQATQSQVVPFFWFLLGLAIVATDATPDVRDEPLRLHSTNDLNPSYAGVRRGS